MPAEAEHGEGDEGVGGFEAEGDAGHEADLGVHGFDPSVGKAMLDRGEDRGAVLHDAFLEKGYPSCGRVGRGFS